MGYLKLHTSCPREGLDRGIHFDVQLEELLYMLLLVIKIVNIIPPNVFIHCQN